MCLATIDKEKKNWRVGYKVFRIVDDTLRSPIFGCTIFKINEWIKDICNKNLLAENCEYEWYPTGFHFFRNKSDAEKWKAYGGCEVVLKIKVRDMVVTGTQYLSGKYREVGVAREIFIKGEQK